MIFGSSALRRILGPGLRAARRTETAQGSSSGSLDRAAGGERSIALTQNWRAASPSLARAIASGLPISRASCFTQERGFLVRIDRAWLLTTAGRGAARRQPALHRCRTACELPGTATCASSFPSWGCGQRVAGSGRVLCIGVARGYGVPRSGQESAGRTDRRSELAHRGGRLAAPASR